MNRRDYTKPAPKRYRQGTPGTTIKYPSPLPQRNRPCPCGSGKKYKHCCKDIETLVNKMTGLTTNPEE